MVGESLKQAEQNMIDKGMSDDQIQLAMTWTKQFMSPVWMTVWAMLGTAFFGCILSLIVAAIFRRDDPNLPPRAYRG
jgi:hypothetical protein